MDSENDAADAGNSFRAHVLSLEAPAIAKFLEGLALLCIFALLAAQHTLAQTETVLHSFGGYGDGRTPDAALVMDNLGNLYGTTSGGGSYQGGIVFELTPSGTETVLYPFGAYSTDGVNPIAGLVIDKAGNLYGTTLSGGANHSGTVFEVTGLLSEKVLYSFGNGLRDGIQPFGPLVLDGQGNLYGTTFNGGAAACFCGTVFQLSASGTVTTLHSFSNTPDGGAPRAGVAKFKSAYYGTTSSGGSSTACAGGCGTVFKATLTGEKVVYSFAGGADGSGPEGNLIADQAGNFYGTTLTGGAFGHGTVFKVTPNGTEKVLYSFSGGPDGGSPVGGLVMDRVGNLYGIAGGGGDVSCLCGAVFELTANGTENVLHKFGSGTDGRFPAAGLVADKNGTLYGTTAEGGTFGYGTVFKLTGHAE